MGAKIPQGIQETELSRQINKAGLERIYQGKVRDTYALPNRPDLLLVVATDRLSIFDFVLNCLVPQKGEILTALTVFWLVEVLKGTRHHLEAYGSQIDSFLPPPLPGIPELQKEGLVVKKLEIIPVECVVRGYLTGSAYQAYQRGEVISGHYLPLGLKDGSRLAYPIFTPTTKEESGHDVPVSAQRIGEQYGVKLELLALKIYRQARDYAEKRSIILADTKFEFGRKNDSYILADEVLTPDSSRFWDKADRQRAAQEGKSPSGYDKEPVREWGRKKTIDPFGFTGVNNLNPENSGHVNFVQNIKVPLEVISATTARYQEIFRRLTGKTLEVFQKEVMRISS